MMSGHDELSGIRMLLASWKLQELAHYFEDEGISVEELQLIQPHHLPIILGNFKLGVRIRFEHYLEKWRRAINRPLNAASDASCNCRCNGGARGVVKPEHKTIGTNTDIVGDQIANTNDTVSVPASTPSPEPPPLPVLPIVSMPKLTPQPRIVESPQFETAKRVLPLRACSSLTNNSNNNSGLNVSTTDATKQSHTPKATAVKSTNNSKDAVPAPVPEKKLPVRPNNNGDSTPLLFAKSVKQKSLALQKHFVVTVLDILKDSGTRGTSIIEYHREFKKLTATHRALLIQLIVEYFDHNDIHLSLNLSHNIETQILKLFPGERLEYYRTEKRGRIYVKFCNMKRYRRDRPWPDKTKRRYIDLGQLDTEESNVSALNDENSVTEVAQANNDSNSRNSDDDDDDLLVQDMNCWMNGKSDDHVLVKSEAMDDDDEDCIPI